MTDAMSPPLALEPPPTGRRLAELIDRQRNLYRQLRGLADEQRQALEAGTTQALLGVLSRRQSVVDELGDVSGRVAAARERWSELTSQLSAEEHRALRHAVDEVRGLADDVMKSDEEDQASLRAMRGRAGDELGTLHTHQHAASAYRRGGPAGPAPAASPPRFADRSA